MIAEIRYTDGVGGRKVTISRVFGRPRKRWIVEAWNNLSGPGIRHGLVSRKFKTLTQAQRFARAYVDDK